MLSIYEQGCSNIAEGPNESTSTSGYMGASADQNISAQVIHNLQVAARNSALPLHSVPAGAADAGLELNEQVEERSEACHWDPLYSEEQLLQEEQQQQQLLQNTQAQLQAQAVQNAVAATAYNLAGYEPLVYPSQLAQQSLAQEQQFQQQMRSNSQHGFSQQHVGPSHLHQQQPLQHQQTFATLPTPAQQAQGLQPPFGFTLPSSSSATCMSTSATRVGAPSHVHGAYGVSPSFLETGSHHTNAAAVSAVAAVAAAAAAMGGADATGGAATNRFLNQNSDTHYRSDHMAMQSILSNSNAYQIHTHPNTRQPHDAYNCLNPTFDPSMPAPLYPYASSASSQQSPGLNQANPG